MLAGGHLVNSTLVSSGYLVNRETVQNMFVITKYREKTCGLNYDCFDLLSGFSACYDRNRVDLGGKELLRGWCLMIARWLLVTLLIVCGLWVISTAADAPYPVRTSLYICFWLCAITTTIVWLGLWQ